MRRVDLHVHSNASDGSYPPDEVASRAARAGLAAFALTDHDTTAGIAQACRAAEAAGVRVVPGCEFSVQAPWGEMHLLGYFLPHAAPDLESFLEAQRGHRTSRMHEIVRRLGASGVPVTMDDVEGLAGGAALGRPHAARAVVRRGAASDLNDAFDRYLGWGRPAFVAKTLPALADVTALIRGAAGVSVAAHLKDRGRRAVLARLRDQGVDGVEVRHPSHDEPTRHRIARVASELDLLPTGGSDWHGDPPGESSGRPGLGEVPVPYEWLDGLERLHNERRTTSKRA